MTLDDCVREVLARSPELAIAQADIVEKEENIQAARKDLYPTLSASYDYLRQWDLSFSPTIGRSFGLENSYNYGVTLQQPMYKGKSLVTAVALSELAHDLSRVSLQKTRADKVRAVHETYYNLLKMQKLEEVARQAVVSLESHRKDAQAFFDAGLIPKNDLLTSEVQLTQGRQDLLKAANNTALARASLNLLMRKQATAALEVVDVISYQPAPTSWEESLAQALKNRPEIRENEIAVQQSEQNLTLTKSAYLPTVTASASYSRQGDTPLASSNPQGPSDVRTAGVTATWRFWSWGQKYNKMAAARQQIMKAEESINQSRDAVTLEVRQFYLELKTAEENIEVTRKAIEQAEENYRINEARYQAQVATSTDVLDAQSLLTQARTNYYSALYDYYTALTRLNWASGTLTKSEG